MIACYEELWFDWKDVDTDDYDIAYDEMVEQTIEVKDQLNKDMEGFIEVIADEIHSTVLLNESKYVFANDEEEAKKKLEDKSRLIAVLVYEGTNSETLNEDTGLKSHSASYKVFNKIKDCRLDITVEAFQEPGYCSGLPVIRLTAFMEHMNGETISWHLDKNIFGHDLTKAIEEAAQRTIPRTFEGKYRYAGTSCRIY